VAEEFELQQEEETGRRGRAKKEDAPPNTSVLLMAALAILLLAFFILLFAMSTTDSKKRRAALGSVAGTFGVLEGAGGGVLPREALTAGGPDAQRARFEASLTLFQDFVKAKGMEKEASLEGSYKGFTISLSSELLFTAGGAELNPKSYHFLDTVKFIVADGQEKFRIRIEGHTDDQPVRGERFASNWELSVARAMAVLRYFLRDSGIGGTKLEAAGFAEFQPRFPNTSPENRARNRRVDFTFLVKDPPRDLDPRKAIEVEGFRFSF